MKRRVWPDLMLMIAPFVALAMLALIMLIGSRPDAASQDGVLPATGGVARGDADALASSAAFSDAELGFAPKEEFSAVVERDLFAGDRRAPPRRQRDGGTSPRLGQPATPKAGDLVLVGVIEGGEAGYRALIAERRNVGATHLVGRGDRIGGYEVVAISALQVTLRQGTQELKLRLGFRSDAGADGGAADSRFRLAPGMKVPRSRSDPRIVYQPVKRDAAGRPTPAAHQRNLRRRVRQWQRKLEDYGVIGGGKTPAKSDDAVTANAPSGDGRRPDGDGAPDEGGN